MKRCPQCYERYENTAMFCEADGQRLLDDPVMIVNEQDLVPDTPLKPRNEYFVIGLIGVLTGVLLCGVAYLGYSLLQTESDANESQRPVARQMSEPAQSRPVSARAAEAAPAPSESPSPEQEAIASPEPSQQPQADVVSARLNRGPISTAPEPTDSADGAKSKTIIEMQDGSVIEVDAAWKDAQGVWYRRGGLVSFVESPRVKAITARAEAKTSPASNQ
jgi:hypothetical protein